ncbi:hypothetical protein BRADI_2g61636v3 [Brachypodium distachyon]|uniref:Ubiquitin-like protease family profile domain-containing protein n=1 Tax=Brachypodium distachyon TaxID=15368 RepID=A0A0Q3REP7_BRADI|nr:hypothetical protein BRADI_2g61636v3 [Brachypodium distachyon]
MEMYLRMAKDSSKEVDRFNRWPDLSVNTWEHVNINHVPRQKDGTSCGLFVIKYIQLWSGSKLSKRFSQKDIEIFRRQLPCDILYSVLNKIKIRDMQMQESEEEIPVSSDSSES